MRNIEAEIATTRAIGDAIIGGDMEKLICMQSNDECQGEVEYHTVGTRLQGFKRCDFHFEQRLDNYENSSERWADSVVAPDGFDEGDAGERW